MANPVASAFCWTARKLIPAYALCGAMLLSAGGLMMLLDKGGWDETLIRLSPIRVQADDAARLKVKIRDALAVMPGTLAKIGLGLLGVAALAVSARASERRRTEGEATAEDPAFEREPAPARRPIDLAIPIVLAALVLVQVAPLMSVPLHGDELGNYEQHLVLPLKGVLTSMSGANNQLGYSVLAWTSMRILGDSPFSVRLPALLGAMMVPGVVYLLGARAFGRGAAATLALLLALWPDCLASGIQGRSYSLLLVFSILHFHWFERLVTRPSRMAGTMFALTLAAACTLHLWFVILVGAELLFLSLLKVDERLGSRVIGLRVSLPTEQFLLCVTLGGLGAVLFQAGIMHKFLFILTQKNPTAVDARLVLANMGDCLMGRSFDSFDLPYYGERTREVVQSLIGVLALAGLATAVIVARHDAAARFEIAFFAVAFAVAFGVVYVQKPVYLYPRFFMFLPILLGWAGARGWGHWAARGAGDAWKLDPAGHLARPRVDRAAGLRQPHHPS